LVQAFRFMLLLFVGCAVAGHAGTAAGEIIFIPGTGDSQKLLRDLGELYGARQSDLVIIPESIGSSGGIRQVLRGKAVLARVARRLTAAERAAGLRWKQFAFSPVVFATHVDQKGVSNLTTAQVEAVFSGEIRDWSELGGSAGKIYLAEREAGDSSRLVLAEFSPVFALGRPPVGKILYSTSEMIRVLIRHRQTLGYLPLSATFGTSIRSLSLNGVRPTDESLRDGSYPLWLPLAVTWKGELKGPARRFVDFLFSPAARSRIKAFGLVPVRP